MEWQPIETAPRNHVSEYLVWSRQDGYEVVGWSEKDQCWQRGRQYASGYDVGPDSVRPTHWMLLPAPPA